MVLDIIEHQHNRAFYLMKGVAHELYRRALAQPLSRSWNCARVLMDWHWQGGEEDEDILAIARLICEDKEQREARKKAQRAA